MLARPVGHERQRGRVVAAAASSRQQPAGDCCGLWWYIAPNTSRPHLPLFALLAAHQATQHRPGLQEDTRGFSAWLIGKVDGETRRGENEGQRRARGRAEQQDPSLLPRSACQLASSPTIPRLLPARLLALYLEVADCHAEDEVCDGKGRDVPACVA